MEKIELIGTSLEELATMVRIATRYKCDRVIFCNPDFKLYDILYGFWFMPREGIDNFVIIGEGYPFSGLDVEASKVIELDNIHKSITKDTVIYKNADGSYLLKKGKKVELFEV